MRILILLSGLVAILSGAIHCEDQKSGPTCDNNVGFGLELILTKLEWMEAEISSLKEQNRNLSELVSTVVAGCWKKNSVQEIAAGTGSTGSATKDVHQNGLQASQVPQSETEIDERFVYSSCYEVPEGKSGQYMIRPTKESTPFYAYCEMQLHGGGWTVIQRRFNGSENFYRNWADYKVGFGSLDGEFWYGLDRIHLMTNAQRHEILFHMMDFQRLAKHSRYNAFVLGNESEGFSIKTLGAYSGSAGDAFSYHSGMKFSTYDADNDRFTTNCAKRYYGAWWYQSCFKSNLNGKYINARNDQAMCWNTFKGGNDGLMSSMIMIRPV